MKKSTKGLAATGAAAVLLLGGAGSLAYWTDNGTVDGGTLTAGSLDLAAVNCTGGWKHLENNDPVVKIVPGDTVYQDCTTSLTLVGEHIGATLTIDDATISGDLAAALATPVVTLKDSDTGTTISAVTKPGTTNLVARITVDFPFGTEDNSSQIDTATLDSLQLVATQTHDTAAN